MTATDLLAKLEPFVSNATNRMAALQSVANLLRETSRYQWVGLCDVDCRFGLVKNIMWSGPGAPAYPAFPINHGLTGAAISSGKSVNIGKVNADLRYLAAFTSTQSEIIVPIFDTARKNVVGTIDVEREHINVFGEDV